VFDPNNFSQNVLAAVREPQQINNQIQMLTILVNQAAHSHQPPVSQLQSSIAQTQSLLSQAQNIAFNIQRIETQGRWRVRDVVGN
jgi:type IV secretion system protein TrbJ